jgi:photosystem II stability/assembly factor-like uncharacterized protein
MSITMKANYFFWVLALSFAACAGSTRTVFNESNERTQVASPSPSPTDNKEKPTPFVGISFIDDKIGWSISGRSLWQTSDGGKTWAMRLTVPDSPVGYALPTVLEKVQALPNDKALILNGNQGLQKYSASNNRLETLFSDKEALIRSFRFLDEDRGWVAGQSLTKKDGHWDAVVFHTTDGGISWTPVTAPQLKNCDCAFNDVMPLRSGNVLLVGDMLAKVDTAQNHILIEPDSIHRKVFGRLSSAGAVDDKVIWILSSNGNKFLTSNDGGKSWSDRTFTPADYIDDLQFVSRENVIALSQNTVWTSHDGGNTWTTGEQLKEKARSLYQMPQNGSVFMVGEDFLDLRISMTHDH